MSNLKDVHMKLPFKLVERVDATAKKLFTDRTGATIQAWRDWLKKNENNNQKDSTKKKEN